MQPDLENFLRVIEHVITPAIVVWVHRHDLLNRVRKLEKSVFGAAADASEP